MIRRQRFPKLPTQGNYYPMAASAYIEDNRVRLTITTAQPLGVASMAPGQLEVSSKISEKNLYFLILKCYKSIYKIKNLDTVKMDNNDLPYVCLFFFTFSIRFS